jgi:hypothetical protein
MELSIEDKVKIIKGFATDSPPGEFNDVFNGR